MRGDGPGGPRDAPAGVGTFHPPTRSAAANAGEHIPTHPFTCVSPPTRKRSTPDPEPAVRDGQMRTGATGGGRAKNPPSTPRKSTPIRYQDRVKNAIRPVPHLSG
ncbi:hypothetical protein GCM10009753_06120 [Streptantibioticus ferralitis]